MTMRKAIKDFIEKLKTTPDDIDFNELIAVIDEYYDFTPTAFSNGDLNNSADENSGSCKLFSFAKLHGLNSAQTLACFGTYYREDVLQNPDEDNHQNIRNFMKTGWEGVVFEGAALLSS